MSEDVVWDRAKGELRILGRRHMAISPGDLCNYLDSLVGAQVAEVIINNLEFRAGKDEAALFRRERPQATVSEIIDLFIKYDSMTGVGITKVTLPENQQGPIVVETSNPCVKGTVGAAKALLFSWWCGALSAALGRELEARNVTYDEVKNLMRCEIVPRPSK